MVKRFIITGDTHGKVEDRVKSIKRVLNIVGDEETAVIILGDAGLNFYNQYSINSEISKKQRLKQYGIMIYCVRGNHEERPENLGYKVIYDENVHGNVYVDAYNNSIRYFMDGGEYIINGHTVLTIGGAYSVDKYYRLMRAQNSGSAFTGWFEGEQLTEDEMKKIEAKVLGKSYDFVFTHTCPIDWEPVDLFLPTIDQSSVDKTMENWLNKIKSNIKWKIWCFGHYHADRIEAERVEQYYYSYSDMENIWKRWIG